MSTRFLPTQEGILDTWLLNFSASLTAAPASYGVTPIDAAAVAAAVDAWHTAFETASAPSTRTRGTVMAKRGQKKNVVAVARAMAARIRADTSVSNELKIHLGLKLRPRRGEPVRVPDDAPALALHRFLPGLHELRAMGTDTRPSGGKPPRVAALMVYRAVAAGPARGPDDARFLTLSTRVRFASTFAHADHGKTATYFARWVNSKGQPGPWSSPMTAPIAA